MVGADALKIQWFMCMMACANACVSCTSGMWMCIYLSICECVCVWQLVPWWRNALHSSTVMRKAGAPVNCPWVALTPFLRSVTAWPVPLSLLSLSLSSLSLSLSLSPPPSLPPPSLSHSLSLSLTLTHTLSLSLSLRCCHSTHQRLKQDFALHTHTHTLSLSLSFSLSLWCCDQEFSFICGMMHCLLLHNVDIYSVMSRGVMTEVMCEQYPYCADALLFYPLADQ